MQKVGTGINLLMGRTENINRCEVSEKKVIP